MRKLLAAGILMFSALTPIASSAATCTPTESMTEGPYYVAGDNIRKNITDKQPGTKTSLTITILDSSCKAVPNARVDVWHANAAGNYSGVKGNSEKFLRGSLMTNSQGKVTFSTIFPGWYPGRVMHIHVKIWRDGNEVLTTQLFANDAQVSKVYSKGVYASRGDQNTKSTQDRIFQGLQNPKANLLTLKIGSSITAAAKITLP